MEDINKEIKRYYNDIAEQFADAWYSNESLLPVLKEFLSFLNPKPRILDLGCGAGYESMRLYKLGAEVVGVDYSIEPIRIAKERNPQCRFEVMDFRELDDSLGIFDGIIAVASLIHISDEELSIVFENMKKVIRTDGLVMILVIEGYGVSRERSVIKNNGKEYNRTFYLHSRERLSEIAENKGFKYYRELLLDDESSSYGWKCFEFQSK
ncbi:MAG: class I SAM-dependent methyltransferase [Bacillota bacterium]|nr:class I SAM-dependent methyltransferase [Bacillota bacterium]